MKKIFSAMMFAFVFMSFFPSVQAGEGTAGDYAAGMGKNIGRGLWNVASSPAEIPCTISSDMKENAGTGFFTGFGKGLAFMVRRIIVGVAEIGTFMMPADATIPPVCAQKPQPQV